MQALRRLRLPTLNSGHLGLQKGDLIRNEHGKNTEHQAEEKAVLILGGQTQHFSQKQPKLEDKENQNKRRSSRKRRRKQRCMRRKKINI